MRRRTILTSAAAALMLAPAGRLPRAVGQRGFACGPPAPGGLAQLEGCVPAARRPHRRRAAAECEPFRRAGLRSHARRDLRRRGGPAAHRRLDRGEPCAARGQASELALAARCGAGRARREQRHRRRSLLRLGSRHGRAAVRQGRLRRAGDRTGARHRAALRASASGRLRAARAAAGGQRLRDAGRGGAQPLLLHAPRPDRARRLQRPGPAGALCPRRGGLDRVARASAGLGAGHALRHTAGAGPVPQQRLRCAAGAPVPALVRADRQSRAAPRGGGGRGRRSRRHAGEVRPRHGGGAGTVRRSGLPRRARAWRLRPFGSSGGGDPALRRAPTGRRMPSCGASARSFPTGTCRPTSRRWASSGLPPPRSTGSTGRSRPET